MELEAGYVDWRGNAVDGNKHGGIKATLFLYGEQLAKLASSCCTGMPFHLIPLFGSIIFHIQINA
jgi:hypothetical protein